MALLSKPFRITLEPLGKSYFERLEYYKSFADVEFLQTHTAIS
jgi:hypothetical protein